MTYNASKVASDEAVVASIVPSQRAIIFNSNFNSSLRSAGNKH